MRLIALMVVLARLSLSRDYITRLSLCVLSVLCVSVVSASVGKFTTETQSSQSSHRGLGLFRQTVALKAQASSLPDSTQANDLRFTDITRQAGIRFKHVFSPEKKYIAESMSGGVALFDYDNDGYLDIYFVNSLTVDLAKSHQKTRSALYHNNGDGTFTDVTDKAGVGDVGFGLGVAVGDYNNYGFDDLHFTCFA